MPTVRTILVVDDEEIVRDVARAILRSSGYRVLLAESGEAAMALMREHAHKICLMLLDASMTGWSARSTVASLRSLSPDLAIVVSSGFSSEEALRHFDPDRVSGFVQKPYTASRLRDAVSLVLQTRRMAA
ncbi:MAG: response regulator [Bryobacteraceae bacterium]|jgi:CheY-like chemotaxis protein